ncbi:MAG TPA: hypothetical protein PKG60_12340 [Spirochaetota bacterium]|nr:hypothetical protein [Spirochaetota bacterium]
MNKDFVERVFKRIVAINCFHNLEAIPHSDVFFKETEALLGLSVPELELIISILKESHKIFVMEISREDSNNKIEKIFGYVDADLLTIQKLRDVFHKALMDDYEKDTGRRKTSGQIIKELIPQLHYINHTPRGRLLNKTIMLDEYSRLLERDYKEYTEEWKEENLQLQLSVNEDLMNTYTNDKKKTVETDSPSEKKGKPERAVDSPLLDDFSKQVSAGSISRVLHIYGVDFFYRVNLRQYKFDYLSQVLDTGVIDRKSDLVILKEMIKKIKENMDLDKELDKYYDEIMSLDRKVSRNISFSKK